MYVIFNFADPIIFNVIIYQCKIIRPENVYLFTCALICRLSTYLLSGKPYSSKGHDSSTMKGKNPYFVSTSYVSLEIEKHILMKTVKVKKLKRVRWLKIMKFSARKFPIFNVFDQIYYSLCHFWCRWLQMWTTSIHVFSINMSANVTRVPSYHAIPTCILYYQERFMHIW